MKPSSRRRLQDFLSLLAATLLLAALAAWLFARVAP